MTPETQAQAEAAASYALNAMWENMPEWLYEAAGDAVPDDDWDEFSATAEDAFVKLFIKEYRETTINVDDTPENADWIKHVGGGNCR